MSHLLLLEKTPTGLFDSRHEEADLAVGINSSKSKYALRSSTALKKDGDVVMAQ